MKKIITTFYKVSGEELQASYNSLNGDFILTFKDNDHREFEWSLYSDNINAEDVKNIIDKLMYASYIKERYKGKHAPILALNNLDDDDKRAIYQYLNRYFTNSCNFKIESDENLKEGFEEYKIKNGWGTDDEETDDD